MAVPAVDVLDLDDERLVLVDQKVALLSPVASVVHRLLGPDPQPLSVLLARVAELLPLPEDPEGALRTVVEDLAAEGLAGIVRDA